MRRVIARRVVDATFTDTATPSQTPPRYGIDERVTCISPNELPHAASASEYVVIGGGKTSMDVCLWLLAQGVSEQRISWVMPRDSWLLDRRYYEPGDAAWPQRVTALTMQAEVIQEARSIDDLLLRLNECGQLLRLDPRVVPGRYRCATVSLAELEALRRIEHVVRLGHVQRIHRGSVALAHGTLSTDSNALYIDCSASGIRSRPTRPVFAERMITLQPVRTCQQCFSSALIAHVDLSYETDARKNALCKPIALPIRNVDWLHMFIANIANQSLWNADAGLRSWIASCRLDVNYGRRSALSAEEGALLQRFKAAVGPAVAKATQLLAARTPPSTAQFLSA
jgi:hypothetical protein